MQNEILIKIIILFLCIFTYILYLSDIGDGWKPVVINSQVEYNFIREAQKVLSNSVPYWIGGSANYLPNVTINYNDYIANNSGTHIQNTA